MANYYVSNTQWAALTPWAASAAVTVGMFRRQLAAVTNANARVFRCTTAGTTGGTEPTWALGNNATTNDGTAVWTQVAGQEAHQTTGAWKPFASTAAAASVMNPGSSDIMYHGSDHNQIETVALSVGTSTGADHISIDQATATIPPVPTDYKRGARLQSGDTTALNITGGRFFGFDFAAGNGGAGTALIDLIASNGALVLDDCTLTLNNTSASSSIRLNSTLTSSCNWQRKVKVVFKGNQTISLGRGLFQWTNSPDSDTVTCTGTTPTNMFSGAFPSRSSVRGVDLSGFTGTNYYTDNQGRVLTFENCILNPAVNKFATAGYTEFLTSAGPAFLNCDDVTNNRPFTYFNRTLQGNITSRLNIARVGGAEIDGQAFSLEAALGSGSFHNAHMRFPLISFFNETVGIPITLTAYMLEFGASSAVLKKDFYFEVEALTGSTKFFTELHSTFVRNDDTTASDTDTSDWTLGVPVRANSTSYTQYDIYQAASSPGRVFMRTNSGTSNSAASEPAAVATANDGDSFADGGTFRAGRRVKTSISITPTERGLIKVSTRLRYVTGRDRIFFDPKIVVT